eukprot:1216923-Rhodomonas_salina.1
MENHASPSPAKAGEREGERERGREGERERGRERATHRERESVWGACQTVKDRGGGVGGCRDK